MAKRRPDEPGALDIDPSFAHIAAKALASEDPLGAVTKALEAAHRAGRAMARGVAQGIPKVRDIDATSMSSRTREAFETLRALSGAQLRDDMEVIILREEEDFTGTRRVNLLQPRGWNDHSWGVATLAPLRSLQIIVPIEPCSDTLTLSRRGADLMRKGRTTTDVSPDPFWEIPSEPHHAPTP